MDCMGCWGCRGCKVCRGCRGYMVGRGCRGRTAGRGHAAQSWWLCTPFKSTPPPTATPGCAATAGREGGAQHGPQAGCVASPGGRAAQSRAAVGCKGAGSTAACSRRGQPCFTGWARAKRGRAAHKVLQRTALCAAAHTAAGRQLTVARRVGAGCREGTCTTAHSCLGRERHNRRLQSSHTAGTADRQAQ